MIIGIPKEIKDEEYRVSALPSTVEQLVKNGHTVLFEKTAAEGIGISSDEYKNAGAEIVETGKEVWERSEMIYKVKEPLLEEYKYFRENLIIFCYLHLAANENLVKALVESKTVGIAYETVEKNGALPLLKPMSVIGGSMGIFNGLKYLEKTHGGKGKMISGMPGVAPGHVVVIGAGVAGQGAIRTAVGLGARVTALDVSFDTLLDIQNIYGGAVETMYSNPANVMKSVKDADIVVSTVLIPGYRAINVVTEEMVKQMEPGSVIVDVSIDQGGAVETMDHATTHSDPVYIKHGIIHYAVANIPGTVAETASVALSNETTRYAIEIANKGWQQAALDNYSIKSGINTAEGYVTYKAVAESVGYDYKKIEDII